MPVEDQVNEADLAGAEAVVDTATGGLSRRKFVGTALGAVAAGGLLAACSSDDDDSGSAGDGDGDSAEESTGDTDLDQALQAGDLPTVEWDMATSWPLVLDTIWGGAEFFAEQVGRMTGGRFQITAAPGGDLVPALEVLQNVQTGAVTAGHTASYYYVGIDPITQLSTAVPFGMTARQHQSWMYEGGGLEMIQQVYRDRFGVVNFPAGNTGCQMGGWFNKEINSVADLGGLRMRIPGLGGSALAELGVSVQVIPGGEIYQSLETGAIDAAEWVGPYDDLNQEFNKVTQFYYYPGWWEPGPSLDVMFPADEFDALPEEYQAVLESAAAYSYNNMLARYDALNPPALAEIKNSGDITILPFPDDVMDAAASEVDKLLDANASADADYAAILASYNAFRDAIGPWHGLAEKAMLDFLAN
ncbi:MAG: ABC transporter substrate-binding protein [Acidimicrobiia bacterium]|nr:ABC transporter substrate-binding protein [Acidimicrobiia bacterium]